LHEGRKEEKEEAGEAGLNEADADEQVGKEADEEVDEEVRGEEELVSITLRLATAQRRSQ
tara:strand:+ start:276 stop:455 length:180 start_codon:yes stop_codon:yes gene_type:complete